MTQSSIEVRPGTKFLYSTLRRILPDVETALFFAKVYKLDAQQVGSLLRTLFSTDLATALLGEGQEHSSELQDYLVELGWQPQIEQGEIKLSDDVAPKGEILPEMWEMLEVTIAKSIQEVADKVGDLLGHMPGKQGEMLFKSMMVMNAKRPVLGDHKAYIHHGQQKPNLVVFDVSGSMSEKTVRTIVSDVVALGYMANASLAIVSNSATFWGPGEYSVDTVLAAAEYGGTHYEELAPLMDEDWGVVVTIADYDSAWSAKAPIAQRQGHIDLLLDVSLVNRATYLSEVLGQKADEIRPILQAENDSCCLHY